jgi:hypothetical protein
VLPLLLRQSERIPALAAPRAAGDQRHGRRRRNGRAHRRRRLRRRAGGGPVRGSRKAGDAGSFPPLGGRPSAARARSPGFRSSYSPRLPADLRSAVARGRADPAAAFVPVTVAGRRELRTPFPWTRAWCSFGGAGANAARPAATAITLAGQPPSSPPGAVSAPPRRRFPVSSGVRHSGSLSPNPSASRRASTNRKSDSRLR